MPKWLKIGLLVLGFVVYLNIGYLVTYSLDSSANQTALSNTIYGMIDFTGYMGRVTVTVATRDDILMYYVVFTLLWPIVVVTSWATNFIVLFWAIFVWFWTIPVWLVTGGIWKWLKLV